MARDLFPDTQRTFIFSCLGVASRTEELQRHLMAVYAAPLRAYLIGSSFRNVGEPDEIINGYLLDRLSRPDFIPKWRARGMRLRHWLIEGLKFYILEHLRREGRHAAGHADLAEAVAADDPSLTAAADRDFARAIVRRALDLTRERSEAAGFAKHHEFFLRYCIDGRSCESLSEESGVGADRIWVMVRTSQRKFRVALRDVLADDGVEPASIDQEIAKLLDLMGGGR